MKIIIAGIIGLAMFVFGAIQVSASNAEVAVDVLNVRAGAGTRYEVIGRLTRGDVIDVVSYENGWIQVKLPQIRLVGTINTYNVNIRAGASTNTEILGRAQEGDVFHIYGVSGDFYRVAHNGGTAYIHGDFIDNAEIIENTRPGFVAAEFVSMRNFTGTVNTNNVNIRERATTSSDVVGRAQNGTSVTVYGVSGEFYRIRHNGLKAYIHSDFVNVTGVAAAVLSNPVANRYTHATVSVAAGLNLRQAPSTSSAVLAGLSNNTAVRLIESGPQWHRVEHNGKIGYISAEFSTLHTGEMPDNSLRTNLVAFSKQFLGLRYVWGGTNLNTGVDCSGFTQSVFRHFGININRVSRDQINNGTRITRDQLRPGDLVFFSYHIGGQIAHVGIYIGGGQFIHSASGSAMQVIISCLDENWYRTRWIGGANVLG